MSMPEFKDENERREFMISVGYHNLMEIILASNIDPKYLTAVLAKVVAHCIEAGGRDKFLELFDGERALVSAADQGPQTSVVSLPQALKTWTKES